FGMHYQTDGINEDLNCFCELGLPQRVKSDRTECGGTLEEACAIGFELGGSTYMSVGGLEGVWVRLLVHTFNPSAREAEAGGLLSIRTQACPYWTTEPVLFLRRELPSLRRALSLTCFCGLFVDPVV
ncbi:hypothetical protein STEG23_012169, partial [Scotinomys teguina]